MKGGPDSGMPTYSWQPRQKFSGSRLEPTWLIRWPQRGQVFPPFICTAMNDRSCFDSS